MDELAAKANTDPLEFRLNLLDATGKSAAMPWNRISPGVVEDWENENTQRLWLRQCIFTYGVCLGALHNPEFICLLIECE